MTPDDELIARRDIGVALLAYTRGVDGLDADLLVSAFHPGAMLEGYGPEEHPIEAFAAIAMKSLPSAFRATQHRLSNTHIAFDGDTAADVETYVVADHQQMDEDGEFIVTFAGRYVDRFELRDERWAMVRRGLRHDWTRRDEVTGHMAGEFVDTERG